MVDILSKEVNLLKLGATIRYNFLVITSVIYDSTSGLQNVYF